MEKDINEKSLTDSENMVKKKLVRFKTSYGWVSFKARKKKGD